MPDYKIFLLDKDHIAAPTVRISANGDEAAVATAKTFLDQHDVELWEDGSHAFQSKRRLMLPVQSGSLLWLVTLLRTEPLVRQTI